MWFVVVVVFVVAGFVVAGLDCNNICAEEEIIQNSCGHKKPMKYLTCP